MSIGDINLIYPANPLFDKNNYWRVGYSPAIFIFENFLAPWECDELIKKAKSRLVESTVINIETGESNQTDYRASSNMFFNRGEEPFIKNIEERLSLASGIPVENGENIQIVKYSLDGYYKPHYDYFDPDFAGNRMYLKKGGQRTATMIMYLNDVEEGGDTGFPEIGVKISPKKGRGLLFWNTFNDLKLDTKTLHSGERVLKGEKWIATKWFHEKEFIA